MSAGGMENEFGKHLCELTSLLRPRGKKENELIAWMALAQSKQLQCEALKKEGLRLSDLRKVALAVSTKKRLETQFYNAYRRLVFFRSPPKRTNSPLPNEVKK